MGSLYLLGGLLKIEAKSFLMTLNEKYIANPEQNKDNFHLVCPLTNPNNENEETEKKRIRKLSEND